MKYKSMKYKIIVEDDKGEVEAVFTSHTFESFLENTGKLERYLEKLKENEINLK